jgi:hypothetical protein
MVSITSKKPIAASVAAQYGDGSAEPGTRRGKKLKFEEMLCFPQGDSVQGCDTSRRNLLEQLVCGKEKRVWTRNDRVFDSVRIQAVGYLGEGPHVRSRPAGPLGFEEDFEGYSPFRY